MGVLPGIPVSVGRADGVVNGSNGVAVGPAVAVAAPPTASWVCAEVGRDWGGFCQIKKKLVARIQSRIKPHPSPPSRNLSTAGRYFFSNSLVFINQWSIIEIKRFKPGSQTG